MSFGATVILGLLVLWPLISLAEIASSLRGIDRSLKKWVNHE